MNLTIRDWNALSAVFCSVETWQPDWTLFKPGSVTDFQYWSTLFPVVLTLTGCWVAKGSTGNAKNFRKYFNRQTVNVTSKLVCGLGSDHVMRKDGPCIIFFGKRVLPGITIYLVLQY